MKKAEAVELSEEPYMEETSEIPGEQPEKAENSPAAWEEKLAESERITVQDLVESYREYCALKTAYEESASNLALIDQADAFNRIVDAGNTIENTKKIFSKDQLGYYYSLIGASTEKPIDKTTETASLNGAVKKGIFAFLQWYFFM